MPMLTDFFDFKAFPTSVKKAFTFLVLGWVWHFFSLYQYLHPGGYSPGRSSVAWSSVF